MTRPSIVYLCGPRTGVPGHNSSAILAVAEVLRGHGYTVLDPVTINLNFMGTEYSPVNSERRNTLPGLRADVVALMMCNAICLMPGWEHRVGCRVEVAIAITFGYLFLDWQTGAIVPRPESVLIEHGYHDAPATT